MADIITEKDDDEELVVVETETLPGPDAAPSAKEAPAAEEPDEEDEEDDEDERLAESQDDSDEEIESASRKKRLKRREVRKNAKERTLQEIEFLRKQNEELLRRVSAVEGHNTNQTRAQIDAGLADAQREVQVAEGIIARAIEAGNGEDVAEALRLRDEAKERAKQLENAKTVAAQPQAVQADPRVVGLGQMWMSANPWYNPRGGDANSDITNVLDRELAAQGYNPATEAYWQELTRRVNARLGGDTPAADTKTPKRKAPPMGDSRENVPTTTRRDVYVTPERKQAMIDAGAWDDPERRKRMLKAYQDYDKNSAR